MVVIRNWLALVQCTRSAARWGRSRAVGPVAVLGLWTGAEPMVRPVQPDGTSEIPLSRAVMQRSASQADSTVVVVRLPDPASPDAGRLRMRTTLLVEVPSRAAGPERLAGVRGLVRSPDGGFLMAESSMSRLRLFSSGGVPHATAGRAGAGPGEFRDMLAMVRCGPRAVAVQDPALNRVQFFSMALGQTGWLALPVGYNADRILGCGERQRLIILADQPRTIPVQKGLIRTVAVVAITSGSGTADTMHTMPGTDYLFARRVPGFVDLPLGQRALAAVGTSMVAAGSNMDGVITLFDLAGRRIRRIRLETPRRRLSASEVLEAYRERVSLEVNKETRMLLTAVLREAPTEAQSPMVEDLRVGLDDRLWVRAYPAEKSLTATWYLVSATGRLEGVLTLPRRFAPYEIGSNYLLGVDHDADGVVTVQLLSLGRDLPPRHDIRE